MELCEWEQGPSPKHRSVMARQPSALHCGQRPKLERLKSSHGWQKLAWLAKARMVGSTLSARTRVGN
jgi:hypothetical protein